MLRSRVVQIHMIFACTSSTSKTSQSTASLSTQKTILASRSASPSSRTNSRGPWPKLSSRKNSKENPSPWTPDSQISFSALMMMSTCSMVHVSQFRGNKTHQSREVEISTIRVNNQVLLSRRTEICQVNLFPFRVYLPLPDIGSIPKENITSRFLDRSLEIKIHGYNGKNWVFAVPKTQCQILVKTSKVVQKADRLIIWVGKIAQNDNWFSLHKVKCIGEKDTDWFMMWISESKYPNVGSLTIRKWGWGTQWGRTKPVLLRK